ICSVPAGCLCCAWCQKVGNASQFSFKTPSGNKVFCSEVCFTQCRRANFKRNKTCDWCRHVRHTVNYVDFQDGDHQLQFCSDKCLNQYKMNIFCKETQAHLELHPHIQDAAAAAAGTSSNCAANNLITPELWMRDCRSQSPDTDRSATPPRIPSPLIEIKMSPPGSPRSADPRHRINPQLHKKSHRDPKRTSSSSPRSGGSVSPPKSSHFQPHLLPPPHFLPHDHPRHPIFFPPGFLPPPQLFSPLQRPPPPRKMQPINRPPLQPPPLLPIQFPQHSLLPPPTTLIPYPLFVPIPVPIPIPIPLPGFRLDKSPADAKPPPSGQQEQGRPANQEQKIDNPEGHGLLKPSAPHRKRKLLVSPEEDALCKQNSVHA
ncbi:hypothetical protein AAG570_010878, partial [Ranatra chinensis]